MKHQHLGSSAHTSIVKPAVTPGFWGEQVRRIPLHTIGDRLLLACPHQLDAPVGAQLDAPIGMGSMSTTEPNRPKDSAQRNRSGFITFW